MVTTQTELYRIDLDLGDDQTEAEAREAVAQALKKFRETITQQRGIRGQQGYGQNVGELVPDDKYGGGEYRLDDVRIRDPGAYLVSRGGGFGSRDNPGWSKPVPGDVVRHPVDNVPKMVVLDKRKEYKKYTSEDQVQLKDLARDEDGKVIRDEEGLRQTQDGQRVTHELLILDSEGIKRTVDGSKVDKNGYVLDGDDQRIKNPEIDKSDPLTPSGQRFIPAYEIRFEGMQRYIDWLPEVDESGKFTGKQVAEETERPKFDFFPHYNGNDIFAFGQTWTVSVSKENMERIRKEMEDKDLPKLEVRIPVKEGEKVPEGEVVKKDYDREGNEIDVRVQQWGMDQIIEELAYQGVGQPGYTRILDDPDGTRGISLVTNCQEVGLHQRSSTTNDQLLRHPAYTEIKKNGDVIDHPANSRTQHLRAQAGFISAPKAKTFSWNTHNWFDPEKGQFTPTKRGVTGLRVYHPSGMELVISIRGKPADITFFKTIANEVGEQTRQHFPFGLWDADLIVPTHVAAFMYGVAGDHREGDKYVERTGVMVEPQSGAKFDKETAILLTNSPEGGLVEKERLVKIDLETATVTDISTGERISVTNNIETDPEAGTIKDTDRGEFIDPKEAIVVDIESGEVRNQALKKTEEGKFVFTASGNPIEPEELLTIKEQAMKAPSSWHQKLASAVVEFSWEKPRTVVVGRITEDGKITKMPKQVPVSGKPGIKMGDNWFNRVFNPGGGAIKDSIDKSLQPNRELGKENSMNTAMADYAESENILSRAVAQQVFFSQSSTAGGVMLNKAVRVTQDTLCLCIDGFEQSARAIREDAKSAGKFTVLGAGVGVAAGVAATAAGAVVSPALLLAGGAAVAGGTMIFGISRTRGMMSAAKNSAGWGVGAAVTTAAVAGGAAVLGAGLASPVIAATVVGAALGTAFGMHRTQGDVKKYFDDVGMNRILRTKWFDKAQELEVKTTPLGMDARKLQYGRFLDTAGGMFYFATGGDQAQARNEMIGTIGLTGGSATTIAGVTAAIVGTAAVGGVAGAALAVAGAAVGAVGVVALAAGGATKMLNKRGQKTFYELLRDVTDENIPYFAPNRMLELLIRTVEAQGDTAMHNLAKRRLDEIESDSRPKDWKEKAEKALKQKEKDGSPSPAR